MTKIVEERGRVEVSLDHPLAQALRPSREVLDRIERLERANAVAGFTVRNMLIGSDAALNLTRDGTGE
jgi:hypothetical protein